MRVRGSNVVLAVLVGALGTCLVCSAADDDAKFVGHKETKTYHRPDCMAAKRIKVENKVLFKTEAAAKKAGFSPCKMCVAVRAKDGKFVASKRGTVYHVVECSSAKKLKPENRVYFKSAEAAEKAGLKPCKRCIGGKKETK